jgi:hypothetical protein
VMVRSTGAAAGWLVSASTPPIATAVTSATERRRATTPSLRPRPTSQPPNPTASTRRHKASRQWHPPQW